MNAETTGNQNTMNYHSMVLSEYVQSHGRVFILKIISDYGPPLIFFHLRALERPKNEIRDPFFCSCTRKPESWNQMSIDVFGESY